MANRLKDYGFINPFRGNPQGSNYNASLADLSGSAIDQWIVDTATYNKIIRDYGLTSQIEYPQPDGTWGPTPPPRPTQNVTLQQDGGRGTMNAGRSRYILNPTGQASAGQSLPLMPKYRWRVVGDVEGANQALIAAGLQGSYTGPKGDKFITGAYIPSITEGAKVQVFSPSRGGGMAKSGGQSAGFVYTESSDPLGGGIGGANSAIQRTYGGAQAPTYYTAPLGGSSTASYIGNIGTGRESHIGASLNSEMQRVANELFANPNLSEYIYDPEAMRAITAQVPAIRDTIGTYINDTAEYYRARDDGGGALGVIARGLSGAAQFASMASGLNAAVSFAGSLAGGSSLGSAIGAARAGAGAIPSPGGFIANEIFNNPALSNAISAGLGAVTGGAQGGIPGAILGGVSGYVGGIPGGIISEVGERLGIGVPPPPPQSPGPFQMMNVPPINDGATSKFASSGSITSNPTVAWNFRGIEEPAAAPTSSAGTVASTIAAQPTAGISPQSAAQTPVAPTVPMGAQTPLLSSMGLLSGALPPQIQQLMAAAPRGGLLGGRTASFRPVTFGGMPVNQQSLMANLPQVLANIRSRAGGAPPAAA